MRNWLIFAALALAGCGGGSDDSPTMGDVMDEVEEAAEEVADELEQALDEATDP
jgi:hypothetical protein